jgi:hypothetical protein
MLKKVTDTTDVVETEEDIETQDEETKEEEDTSPEKTQTDSTVEDKFINDEMVRVRDIEKAIAARQKEREKRRAAESETSKLRSELEQLRGQRAPQYQRPDPGYGQGYGQQAPQPQQRFELPDPMTDPRGFAEAIALASQQHVAALVDQRLGSMRGEFDGIAKQNRMALVDSEVRRYAQTVMSRPECAKASWRDVSGRISEVYAQGRIPSEREIEDFIGDSHDEQEANRIRERSSILEELRKRSKAGPGDTNTRSRLDALRGKPRPKNAKEAGDRLKEGLALMDLLDE